MGMNPSALCTYPIFRLRRRDTRERDDEMSLSNVIAPSDENFQNYAVVVASLSAITSLVYVLPYVRRWVLWPWDFLLWRVWRRFFFLF